MTEETTKGVTEAMIAPGALDKETQRKVEEYIEQEEGAANRLSGWSGHLITALAVFMTLFHLYAAYDIVPTQQLRPIHVGFVMLLIFLLYPVALRFRDRIRWWDVITALIGIATMAYLVMGGDDLTDRASLPNQTDVLVGTVFVVLILEATRRTTGPIMPVVGLIFIAYAMLGPYLPAPWTHRGYDAERLIGHLYMTLEGIFGSAVDVSSSLIILFTIFGAILQFSGAGKFFIDFSFSALGGKSTSAGRAIVLSSFLLGGPSGSGVATTVTIGSVAWPMLKKSGYIASAAGGLLAAGGLGAIISPPVLGAAAFLIAEFLKISYLDVIRMAAIPTVLYYFCLLAMVEFDAGKYKISNVDTGPRDSLWDLTKHYGYHFSSLFSIVILMLMGFSPVLSVFWATVAAIAVSYFRRDTALTPKKLVNALAAGSIGVLGTAATCASAGIIVGVVTLTGLGLKFSAIAIAYAGGSLVLTAVYTALIVWIVGLAVPVTASYIICAVIAAPALIKLGVPDYAAHMFIFYYAVLSEVSPPTALSPFAAAAITGADPYRTTLQSWKYTMPAFLVPFVFVLDPNGVGLLLTVPKGGDWTNIAWVAVTTAAGIWAYAGATQGWLFGRTGMVVRIGLIVAGTLLLFPSLLDAVSTTLGSEHIAIMKLVGMALTAALAVTQRVRTAVVNRTA
ncbi:MAG: TRAP transporter fused permease subunit [Ferrovibrio sp.]|uniref:TRAP transporter permease n=1 Tax=Ferrovibrio sp. TaxID=1917215 RepID=UPI002635CD46|nr:TRAP transporter fused permease subunit [Ferrovibrio sp.]MCW0236575.1 TRAP transporter fused permease subunit [Ferrovibrio sp.]